LQGRTDGRHAEVDCPAGRPDGIDGLRDLAAVSFAELAEVMLGSPDELPQPGDLLVRRHGLGPGPVIEVEGGPDPFPGLQKAVEIAAELGKVGRIGPEVAAAQAAEPERAGSAAGLDVGRLGARPERDRDLADGYPLVLAVEQDPCLSPDPVPAAVELEGGQGVHCGPGAPGGDPLWVVLIDRCPMSSLSTSTGVPASA
jgi:hypothetical protein